jgi:2-oxoacid:acceptor oxidoreductase gamma subunit (pyruvate/2-ketoisovalerate family)
MSNVTENVSTKIEQCEIRFHGRGGQGAMTAAKIIAQAAYLQGYQGVTATPSFGAERRGAPVSASVRISREPIKVVSRVDEPDVVIVLDHTLLRRPEVTGGLKSGGWLVVNSWQHPLELGIKSGFNIVTADATRIAQELGLIVAGLTVVNTAILGAFVRATEIVDRKTVETVMKRLFSERAAETNIAAFTKTYEITEVLTTD